MEISFINVGYGESILIEYGNGAREPENKFVMLIDGGSAQDAEYEGFPQRIRTIDYLKKKGIGRIDILVISHIHDDHVCGLTEVVKQLEIGELWCNCLLPGEFLGRRLHNPFDPEESLWKFLNSLNEYNEILNTLTRKGINIKEIKGIKPGWEIRESLKVDILGPSEDIAEKLKEDVSQVYLVGDPLNTLSVLDRLDKTVNNTSIVLRLEHCGRKILLPGDVYNIYWTGMYKGQMAHLQADIVKIPHHGQADGVSEEFINSVKPDFAVICASSDRRYGSSSPKAVELIERCAAQNGRRTEVFFTDSVHMPPYSTAGCNHNAIVFKLECGSAIEYEFVNYSL